MASRASTLLGIDAGDIDALDDGKATSKEFERALSLLGIKDEPSKSPTTGRPRVYVRPPSKIKDAPEVVQKAVGYANQVTEGMPIIAPVAQGIASAMDATSKSFGQPDPNPYGVNWLDRFNSAQDKQKSESKKFSDENPIGSTVANVAGGTAAMLPLTMTGLGAAMMGLSGPSLAWRAVGGGLGGAGIGGADAALRGDNAGTGALIGGGMGVGGTLLGEGLKQGGSAALNYMFPRQGVLKGMDSVNVNRLSNALTGEDVNSINAARDRIGPAGFFGDLNQGMTDLTGAMAVTPGTGKATVRQSYQTRADQQRTRIEAAADAGLGPRVDMTELAHLTTEAQKAAASPLYNQWRSQQVIPTPELKALIPRLKEAKAFKMAEELSGISGDPINKKFFIGGPQKEFPTTQSWDYIKQSLDRRINQAYNSEGGGPLARELIRLKSDMIGEIEKTNAGQVWKQARQSFADHASLLEQQAAGRDTFLGGRSAGTVDELKHELRTLSIPEIQARVTGARAAVSEAMGKALAGDTIMRNQLLAPNNKEKLKLLIGNKTQSDAMIKALEQEHMIGIKTLDVLGNNATGASNVSRSERKNMLMPPPAKEYNLDINRPMSWVPPSIRDSFTIAGMTNARRGVKYDRANNELAHILTMPNGPQILDLAKALMADQQRQGANFLKTERAGNLLTGAISGPGASVARRRE